MRLPVGRLGFVVLGLASAAVISGQTPEMTGGAIREPQQTVNRVEQAPASLEAAPQPLGYESDLYCFGYLAAPGERFVAQVIGAENLAEQEDFVTDDLLYIDGGADRGIRAGDEFWIVAPGQEIFDPSARRKSLGQFYNYRGRAVVLCAYGRSSIIRVVDSCTDIPIGSFVKPFEPIPIPLARRGPAAKACDPASGKQIGQVVYTKDGVISLGADNVVMVNLGVADGVQPGDSLTIFRIAYGREYSIKPYGDYWSYAPPPPGMEIPRTYLGELSVLQVGDRWAVGRITESYRLIEVGDQVEIR
ncbi:MAG TPA: hypothetical protein VIE39_10580 [Thermoanaerobaculia bacterium]